jgi:hypothetical protein
MTTVTAIENVTAKILGADADSENGKVEYLRLLVGDIQTDLGGSPRMRNSRAARLSNEERGAHLKVVATVNERFYTVVVDKAKELLSAGADRAKRLNTATNWARTITRDVRKYVRAGNDLRALSAAKLVRSQLRVSIPPRPPTPAVLRRRLVEQGKELVAAALELIDTDPIAARAELELIMAQMATQLLNLGGKPTTRDAQEAASQHKPFRIKSTVFIPTETMVARQVSAPS